MAKWCLASQVISNAMKTVYSTNLGCKDIKKLNVWNHSDGDWVQSFSGYLWLMYTQ